MSKEMVAGRTALWRSFREFFTRSLDDGRDTRSFLSFRKQREIPASAPWIFVFHGEECLGKSTALRSCIELADEIASEFKRSVNSVVLDWDDWSLANGPLPSTRIELLDTVVSFFTGSKNDFSGHFSSCVKFSESYHAIVSRVEELLIHRRLDMVLADKTEQQTDGSSGVTDLAVLHTILTEKELDLYQHGETRLAEMVVNSLLAASEENAFIFAIDGYDRIAPDLEPWFRREILAETGRRRGRFILFVSGGSPVLRVFRNEFPEDAIYAVNLADNALTRQSIVQLAHRRHVELQEGDSERIEATTAGIPLLVNDLLFYAAQNISLDLLTGTDAETNDVHDAEILCGKLLERFFARCGDEAVRERIFTLAMLSQSNAKALAEIWGIPFADVKSCTVELEAQVSFLKDLHIHHHVRRLLRSSLIDEAAHGSQSALKPLFMNFSAANSRVFRELLTQLHTAVPNAAKRCRDPRYLSAIEQLICGHMWSSPTNAFMEFPGYYLELIHFNPQFAAKLLERLAEFRPLFSPINEKTYQQLTFGLHLSAKESVLNRAPVEQTEEELLAGIETVSESMNDFHRALFYHIKASLELRKGNLTDSKELLDRSFSLLGNSAPEKESLYEEYVVLGHAFSRAEEHRFSIETFSNAVLIRADGFIPWYSMGISRIALKEYEGAANALAEAVKIDPLHTEAWFRLGCSYMKEKLYSDAVNALLKATELAPERADIWFELGTSYRELGRHTDAVKALRKVVIMEDGNSDAWLLMGRSCSELGTADEAIEAYGKAAQLTPGSLEPLKALGFEYLKLDRFDDALHTFGNAAKISRKDPELWCLIAEAGLGAGDLKKAIDAGEKALAIDKNNPRAWKAIGNGQSAAGNPDAAVEAFLKAVEFEPDNADIWHKLGTVYSGINEHDKAIDAFKKAVAFNPALKEVWYTIGMAYETRQQYADAVAAYEKGTDADPANIDCWIHLGHMHRTLEQHSDAYNCYARVTKLDPSLIEGWFSLGDAAIKTSNLREAVASFSKVVELDADNAEGWFRLGCAYRSIDDHQEAVRSFTEAAAHDGNRTDIWVEMGESCRTLGMFDEAVAAYEKCMELDPDNATHAARLGECHYTLNHFAQAYAAYKKAVELDPDNIDTLYHLALTCHAQENHTEAIEHYRAITVKKSDHAEAWFNLALAYHAIADYSKAIETYLICVDKWPENGMSWFNLGLAYHTAEDLDNAILTYKEATRVIPEDPEVWFNLGLALHAKEQYGDAIQAYRKVTQFMPDHINAWFNLGMAYYVWQNYDDAVDAYSRVVKLDPDHYTGWGNLAIGYFAAGKYEEGCKAAMRAWEIKPDEAWITGNLIVGLLFTGKSAQAQEYVDHLPELDPTGEAAEQIAVQIHAGLKKNPDIEGARELLRKLRTGGRQTAAAVTG